MTLSRLAITLSFAVLGTISGCGPVTLSATLFRENAKLHEVPVEEDKGYSGKVALIDVRGLIADRNPSPLLGPSYNPVDELAARLRRARTDPSVRAVILRINSPGGTVTASDVMYREVRRFQEESGKPVVASLGEVAASGGYYLALSADRIVAEPTSITASIGVIIPTINLSEGLGKIGIHSRSVTSGKNKDIANPLEPERDPHFAILQGIVDEFYAGFRGKVLERRGDPRAIAGGNSEATAIDVSRVDDLTDGRIMTGKQALAAGLVDSLGGVQEAFEVCKRLSGLKSGQLVKYYREDADTPRSPYAPTAVAPTPQGSEINLIQIRAESLSGVGGLETSGAYYLWLPPG